VVPSGKAIWNSTLLITKGIILKGAGIDKTVIVGNINNGFIIQYEPSDFSKNWAFRVSGFTFDLNNVSHGIYLKHLSSTDLTIQTKIRIDHNRFTGSADSMAHQAIWCSGMRGVVDSNFFDGIKYPIRNLNAPTPLGTRWNNWEGFRYGKEDNSIYYEDNVFTGVYIVMDCQDENRYVVRYNTITAAYDSYPLFDAHGNGGTGYMYSTFGVEIYGNLIQKSTSYGVDLLDHRGGKALVFMNTVVAPSVNLFMQVRDEYPDSLNPETNSDYQFPNDAYYFLNRKNYTGDYATVYEGEHSDNPPFYNCPTKDRDYFVGTDSFDGSSGVGYGTLSQRPTPTLVGVGYWATDQNIADLHGAVGANPTTPISGTLYKCTAPGVWIEYYKPYTYPHPLRKLLND
jgi:hypothetical protein